MRVVRVHLTRLQFSCGVAAVNYSTKLLGDAASYNCPLASGLEVFAELLRRQARVARDTTHCERIDWIVARNRHLVGAVGHDDMFALSQDPEASLFQRTYGVEVIHSGK